MGFRYRKSIRIAKGVRLNVSKSGVGVSAGVRGARYSVHSSGRRTATVGIPGSGMSWQSSSSSPRRPASSGRSPGPGRTATTSTSAAPPPATVAEEVGRQRPGLFASKGEKALHRALLADDIQAMHDVTVQHPEYALAAETIAGLKLVSSGDQTTGKALMSKVFTSGQDPAEQPFMKKYLPNMGFEVPIAPGVGALLPVSRDAIGLLLAELHQASGDSAAAIGVVEQLEPTAHAAVSLAELYCEGHRYADVVELTEGISNEDDATALLCVFRGIAFREQGYQQAAREAFKEALKSKKRDQVIRHRALLERARTYLAEGKRAMARKDLERIMAEDSTYEGLSEMLAQVSG